MTQFTTMTFLKRTFLVGAALMAAALAASTTSALAQAAAPTPWELKPDMGYGYDKEGKTFAYKMGTNNAGTLLKGAKKVPKGTLFFIGHNGQLYIWRATASSCSGRIEGAWSPRLALSLSSGAHSRDPLAWPGRRFPKTTPPTPWRPACCC